MRKLFLAFCGALLWASAACAQGVAPADAAAIRSTIERQIDAFRADDGERAFGFADASIRAMFGDPARFMAMVREGYAMFYRPRRFEFAETVERPDGYAQAVEFDGLDGTSALAVYEMRRQPDGSFRIAGVHILKARKPSV